MERTEKEKRKLKPVIDRMIAFRVLNTSDRRIYTVLRRRTSNLPIIEVVLQAGSVEQPQRFTWLSTSPLTMLVSLDGRDEFFLDNSELTFEPWWAGDPMPTWYEEIVRIYR